MNKEQVRELDRLNDVILKVALLAKQKRDLQEALKPRQPQYQRGYPDIDT